MPMINPNVVRAVHELLQEKGITQREDEHLDDYIARGLGVSKDKVEIFLEALRAGKTTEDARAEAKIGAEVPADFLTKFAKEIGATVGRLQSTLTT
jgi:hypothetical protein